MGEAKRRGTSRQRVVQAKTKDKLLADAAAERVLAAIEERKQNLNPKVITLAVASACGRPWRY